MVRNLLIDPVTGKENTIIGTNREAYDPCHLKVTMRYTPVETTHNIEYPEGVKSSADDPLIVDLKPDEEIIIVAQWLCKAGLYKHQTPHMEEISIQYNFI